MNSHLYDDIDLYQTEAEYWEEYDRLQKMK